MSQTCQAYVLVTCLYLLLLLSVSGLSAMRFASLMSEHTRLLGSVEQELREAHAALQAAESLLLRGESPAASASACETSVHSRLRVFRLHQRQIGADDEDGEIPHQLWVVYGIQACRGGRALMESTLGVVEPVGITDEAQLPPNLHLGRLSLRRVW